MTSYPSDLKAAADYFGRIERDIGSVRFCRQVYTRFVVDGEPANEHMNAEKALAQFVESVNRLLETASKR